jgi:hypothetical protein
MKVARMPVRVLEAESSLAEVDLPGNAGFDHPLQRPIDRGSADAGVFVANQVDQFLCGKVPFLAQEDLDDEVTLGGSASTRRP